MLGAPETQAKRTRWAAVRQATIGLVTGTGRVLRATGDAVCHPARTTKTVARALWTGLKLTAVWVKHHPLKAAGLVLGTGAMVAIVVWAAPAVAGAIGVALIPGLGATGAMILGTAVAGALASGFRSLMVHATPMVTGIDDPNGKQLTIDVSMSAFFGFFGFAQAAALTAVVASTGVVGFALFAVNFVFLIGYELLKDYLQNLIRNRLVDVNDPKEFKDIWAGSLLMETVSNVARTIPGLDLATNYGVKVAGDIFGTVWWDRIINRHNDEDGTTRIATPAALARALEETDSEKTDSEKTDSEKTDSEKTDSDELARRAMANYATHGLGNQASDAPTSGPHAGRAMEAEVVTRLNDFIRTHPDKYLAFREAFESAYNAEVVSPDGQQPSLAIPKAAGASHVGAAGESGSVPGGIRDARVPVRAAQRLAKLQQELQQQQARLADQQQARGDAHRQYAENRVEMGIGERSASWLRRTARVRRNAQAIEEIHKQDAAIRETKKRIDKLQTTIDGTVNAALHVSDPVFIRHDKERGRLRQLNAALSKVQSCLDTTSQYVVAPRRNADTSVASRYASTAAAARALRQLKARTSELMDALALHGVVVGGAQLPRSFDRFSKARCVDAGCAALGLDPVPAGSGILGLLSNTGEVPEQLPQARLDAATLADAVAARLDTADLTCRARIDQALAACEG